MFVDDVQRGRIEQGQSPARRPVFLRLHGVAHGRLEVRPDLPEALSVGLFGQGRSYAAWVRFSSDLPDGRPDYKSTCGIGIKLFDVAGTKQLPPETDATTADLILQNHDVFFVDDAQQMCDFTRASLSGQGDEWLKDHPRTAEVLQEMAKEVPTVLGTPYWSVIPFHFGANRYCKYKLEPECFADNPALRDGQPGYGDPDYMAVDLRARLGSGEARFRLLVQLQTDPTSMPLDQATVPWSEQASPPQHVATLILPHQDTTNRGQADYGEELAFNVWQVPAEHQPVGSIAEVRRVVYQTSADLRRNVNGQPLGEPRLPRPTDTYPPGRDTRIVRAAIHPGIGVARIGDSPHEFFIGPEVTDPPPTPAGGHRDATGAIKRQAARFRIYGYNCAGEVVAELTASNAEIRWQAHLANRKAAWYRFIQALDIPESVGLTSSIRRNKAVPQAERDRLVIDPGPREISGSNQSGAAYRFDTGKFLDTTVYLGELRTDAAGRLLVLGGRGVSATPTGAPIFSPDDPDSFNNANDWHDDTSDGPVSASVRIDGREIPVEPAWVIVAPPNYAPDAIAWRTLYDLLEESYIEAGWLPYSTQISFTQDILPMLQRLSGLQWVNAGFAAMYGPGRPFDMNDPNLMVKLASKSDAYRELRRTVVNSFRSPEALANDRGTWPWIYGDAFGSANAKSVRNNLTVPPVRFRMLQQWVAGDFEADWDPSAQLAHELAEMLLAEQPTMLDKAALHFCLADAFHPGCEVTWPMRHTSLYSAPFRIRARPAGESEPDYGSTLTPTIALRPDGPLYAQGPGDLTRWMALPWQADTAFCRSGYDPSYDPYLPTFWPARVPNQVLSERNYAVVVNTALPREVRLAAFSQRSDWERFLKGSTTQQMLQMVANFANQGIVEMRPGIPGDPDFPPVIWVESLPQDAQRAEMHAKLISAEPARLEELVGADAFRVPADPVEAAGWESEAQLEEFRRVRRW